jgi:hypothetical protein
MKSWCGKLKKPNLSLPVIRTGVPFNFLQLILIWQKTLPMFDPLGVQSSPTAPRITPGA